MSSRRPIGGFTFLELMVVIGIFGLLLVLFLAVPRRPRTSWSKISCVNNLRQVGLAFRIWADDNGGRFPQAVPVAEGGGAGYISTPGEAAPNHFRIFGPMRNELGIPRIVVCPSDRFAVAAKNWDTNQFSADSSFTNNQNVSYLVGTEATEETPLAILSGDRNLGLAGQGTRAVAGKAFGKGDRQGISIALSQFQAAALAWTAGGHTNQSGNIGLGDGSVHSATTVQILRSTAKAAFYVTNATVVLQFPN